MEHRSLVAFAVFIALIAVVAATLLVYRKRRSLHLKQLFGPEYDRAVLRQGDPAKAEAELMDRENRVHSLSIKTLNPIARDRFREEWTLIQSRFVDDPAIALTEADALVNRVMVARGYPVSDFEQRAADVSVSYPAVVQNYRNARSIAQRNRRGEATTEELRQAMVLYRSLFDELLDIAGAHSSAKLQERAS